MSDNMKLLLSKIIQYIFESLFVMLIIFFIAEYMKAGIITNYFHYNDLLTLTIFFGIIVIIWGENGQKESKSPVLSFIACTLAAFFSAIIAVLSISQKFFMSGAFENSPFLYASIPWVIGVGVFFTALLILRNK